MRPTFAMPLLLSAGLLALTGAAAADCTRYMADLIQDANQAGHERLQVSMTIKQGNGLSAASTPFYASNGEVGPPGVAEIDRQGGLLQGTVGKLIYSDRYTARRYGHPYSIKSTNDFAIYVNAVGHVRIHNHTWGVWTDFQGECLNPVLYGWGAPIGLNNGSDQAMYVISFQKIAAGYL